MLAARDNIESLKTGITAGDLRKVNKGALVGFCQLTIHAWHLVLSDCKWFRKDGNEWIALPSSSYTNRDGKTVYKNLVEFSDKEAAARFQEAALAAVRRLDSSDHAGRSG